MLASFMSTILSLNPKIREYEILAFPGGFSHGDDTDPAMRMRVSSKPSLAGDIGIRKEDTLVIGICNGCQILVSLGLVPALGGKYGKREVALLHNSSTKYVARWTDMKIENEIPWFQGISHISLPIAHGKTMLRLKFSIILKKRLVALRYECGSLCEYQNLPSNPTGTLRNIAAITNENGEYSA